MLGGDYHGALVEKGLCGLVLYIMRRVSFQHQDLPISNVQGALTGFLNEDHSSKWRDHRFIKGSLFGHCCDIAMVYQSLDRKKTNLSCFAHKALCLVFLVLLVIVQKLQKIVTKGGHLVWGKLRSKISLKYLRNGSFVESYVQNALGDILPMSLKLIALCKNARPLWTSKYHH